MRTSIQNLISHIRVLANDVEHGRLDGASVWVDAPTIAEIARRHIAEWEAALKVPAEAQYEPPLNARELAEEKA